MPTRKFLIRSNLWLIVPVISLFLFWMISAYGMLTFASDFLRVFRFLVFLFAPGCYFAVFLGKEMGLSLDEVLALDVLISIAMATFVSVYLSFSLLQIRETEMMGGLFVATAASGLFLLSRLLELDEFRTEVTLSKAWKAVTGLIVSFLIGFLLTMRVIPESFWRGWDPWLNTPVAKTILEEGLNPFELKDRYMGVANVGISGFYYFLAAIQVFTGIDFYSISRFGGPVLAGIASMITYLVVRRLEGTGPGLLASFLLFLNPFFVTRFSMALRENFSFIFFLGILFLLIFVEWGFRGDRISQLYFCFVLSLFLAVSLSSHSLVPIIVYGVVVWEIIFLFLKREHTHVELVSALFLSFLLAAPYLLPSTLTYVWTIRNWFLLSPELFFSVFIVAVTLTAFILYSQYRKKVFRSSRSITRKSLFLISAVLFVGTVYSIIFPKSFPILGSYNPPITLGMFAISSLILACLGFLTIFKSSVPTTIISLSLLLISIPNLTNVNVAFPLFRLVMYISWVLSYSGAKLFGFINNFYGKVKLKFSTRFHLSKKTFEIGNWRASVVIYIMLLTLISPLMFQDVQAIKKGYSNYTKEDVESALNFTKLLREGDIVVPQACAHPLLIYVGININKMIYNESLLQELYSTTTIQDFSRIILSKYPNTSRVHVFMIERRIGNKDFSAPPLKLLELCGEKHQLSSIVFYTISLSRFSEEEV